jgi:hypothetical protein
MTGLVVRNLAAKSCACGLLSITLDVTPEAVGFGWAEPELVAASVATMAIRANFKVGMAFSSLTYRRARRAIRRERRILAPCGTVFASQLGGVSWGKGFAAISQGREMRQLARVPLGCAF